jgi:beta-phosphoglucomutase-like phosphatase (HAD superfamily)
MRYRCLIIDHDDTAVDSTRQVHHPSHVRSMQLLRPEHRPISVEGWLAKNSEPGLLGYLVNDLRLTEEELATSFQIWREFTANAAPTFYPGFLDALAAYRAEGGAIVVASHSESHVIRRHYQVAGND